MSNHNLIKIAMQVRAGINSGKSFSLPVMRADDFLKVMKVLKAWSV